MYLHLTLAISREHELPFLVLSILEAKLGVVSA